MTDKATLCHPEKAHKPDNPVAMREAVLAANGEVIHISERVGECACCLS